MLLRLLLFDFNGRSSVHLRCSLRIGQLFDDTVLARALLELFLFVELGDVDGRRVVRLELRSRPNARSLPFVTLLFT